MVTTRRGKSTAVTRASPPKAKGKASAKKARKSEVGNGSYAAAENGAQQQHNSKKRGADEAEDVTPAEVPKRQKKASKSTAEADLQVKAAEPAPLEEKSAVPEADTITAAAAMDPPAGSETAVTAEDLAPAPAAASEEEVKPDVSNTSEMPVEEAVKVIGGTQAGSAPVSEAPTANKALDAVPVGPDPAAAAPAAADDTPQDGEYFLDATLADSMQGNEESKPAEHVTEAMGTTDAAKTGFLAPPSAATGTGVEDDQTGMAADVAPAAPIDVPIGVHADKDAVTHTMEGTGTTDTMHEAITTAPTTVDTHDSHFGAAAAQDAADLPTAV